MNHNNPSLVIPETIRDTVRLARALECKYVWVDSLCIVQDDEENKKEQLNALAAIYAAAYLTVVADTGFDANGGSISLGYGSKPRVQTCGLVNVTGHLFVAGGEMVSCSSGA
jgi:hypothetical protein